MDQPCKVSRKGGLYIVDKDGREVLRTDSVAEASVTAAVECRAAGWTGSGVSFLARRFVLAAWDDEGLHLGNPAPLGWLLTGWPELADSVAETAMGVAYELPRDTARHLARLSGLTGSVRMAAWRVA
jgi:hypothetical protein